MTNFVFPNSCLTESDDGIVAGSYCVSLPKYTGATRRYCCARTHKYNYISSDCFVFTVWLILFLNLLCCSFCAFTFSRAQKRLPYSGSLLLFELNGLFRICTVRCLKKFDRFTIRFIPHSAISVSVTDWLFDNNV